MTCIWIYDDCGKPCVGAYESIQRALLSFFGFGFFSPLIALLFPPRSSIGTFRIPYLVIVEYRR
jgi:hypothetical protein